MSNKTCKTVIQHILQLASQRPPLCLSSDSFAVFVIVFY